MTHFSLCISPSGEDMVCYSSKLHENKNWSRKIIPCHHKANHFQKTLRRHSDDQNRYLQLTGTKMLVLPLTLQGNQEEGT